MGRYLFISILLVCAILYSCNKNRDTATNGAKIKTEDFPDGLADSDRPVSLNETNPHYFQFRNKPTILITSGEHYGSVINLDFDYKSYLDELEKQGFNLTRLFAGPYVEFAGWFHYSDNQPLSPAPGRFICPWKRSDVPGYINGGNKFDLTEWDDAYFRRLKDFLTRASERGIVVELTLFCPYYRVNGSDPDLLWKYSPLYYENNVNGIGNISRTRVLTMDNGDLMAVEDAYVTKMVRELKNYDNIIYEICNEPYIQDLVSYDWMVHIAELIQSVESDFEYSHLLSQNVANGASLITNPVPGVSVFNFHYSNPSAVKLNYNLNRVIGNNETDGFASNILLRVEAWDFITGGGGLYNNLDMSFTTTYPAGGPPGGPRIVLRNQLSIMKHFIEEMNFPLMKPDTTVLNETILLKDYSGYVLSDKGHQYLVYLHKKDLNDTNSVKLNLKLKLPPGRYNYSIIDPLTGNTVNNDLFTYFRHRARIETPDFQTDVGVKLSRKKLIGTGNREK